MAKRRLSLHASQSDMKNRPGAAPVHLKMIT